MENIIDVRGRVGQTLKNLVKTVADETLKLMGQPGGLEIAVIFVNENKIREINSEFRQIDKVTDVLSFPSTNLKAGEIFDSNSREAEMLKQGDIIHFGDMAICFSKIKSQANEYGVSVEDELKKIVIHSTLHLMGYDHIKDEDYAVMKKQEEMLFDKIKI